MTPNPLSVAPKRTDSGISHTPLKSPLSPSHPCSPRSPRRRRRQPSILKRPPPLTLSRTLNPFVPKDIILILSAPPTTATNSSKKGKRSGMGTGSGRGNIRNKENDLPLVSSPHVHFPPSAKLTSLIVSTSRFSQSSPSSASSRYSEDGKARIIVSPNPPLVNERDEECLEEKDTDDIESSGVLYLSPPLAASPAFYRYPDSPYPSSEAQSSANSTSTCSMSPSPRLPLTQSNQADGLTRAGLRLFESVHTQLASLDNESGRQPIILDKALKAYPRSPYPTATFDFDHQKLGDSDEEEDMYTDKVPRLGPVRANTIAVSTNHRGRDRTVKALSCSANAQTIPAEDTVITPVATSIPIAADSDAVQCPQCAVSVSRPEVIDIPVPISVSPESVASNVTNVSAVSGTSSLRNAFWQSLSLEEGPEEDVPASWFLGAPPPPKSTGKAMPIQVGSPKEVNKPDNSLGTPATNLLDFHSRLGLPTPPILLGTKDGDIIRWPESAASRSNLVDIPLSPFVSSQNQSSPRRLPALRASKAQERKAKRLTLPLDSGTLGTPTESEWLSWKSGFSASTRRSMSFDLTSDDGQPSSEINSIPFPVVMSPMPRTAKDRLPSFATAVSDLP